PPSYLVFYLPLLTLKLLYSKPNEVQAAVEKALAVGYKHIDGAYMYQNETDVGKGIRSCIDKGIVRREELFIVTKLWNTFHEPAIVQPACRESLTSLGLPYVDLYLMHSPLGFQARLAMENLVDEGLVKYIGVSNFNISQLERLLSVARIKPLTNQIELHPYFSRDKLVQYCNDKGITVVAYSPFGAPYRPFKKESNDPHGLLQDPVVAAIAKKHGKTSAQVLLRYHIQRGIVVIPKSVTPARIVENSVRSESGESTLQTPHKHMDKQCEEGNGEPPSITLTKKLWWRYCSVKSTVH
uniref:Aldo-keto reductase family 1, member B1 (aldose reductase), tandem duplicate 1 n=1 Tax=Eptatretus burgeri TaxID=7764 RepID=A0A8C4QPY5_EPTBU